MQLSQLPARILARTEAEPNSGCWLCDLRPDVDGYPRYQGTSAHRFVFTLDYGPIPAEHVVHHKCETKACVNPAHLELLSRQAHPSEHLQTHCKRGHEYAATGFRVWASLDGWQRRRCNACERLREERRAMTRQ